MEVFCFRIHSIFFPKEKVERRYNYQQRKLKAYISQVEFMRKNQTIYRCIKVGWFPHSTFFFFFFVQIYLRLSFILKKKHQRTPYDPDVFFFNCDTGKYKGAFGGAQINMRLWLLLHFFLAFSGTSFLFSSHLELRIRQ